MFHTHAHTLSLDHDDLEGKERTPMAQDKFLPNGAPSYERIQVVDDQKKFTSVFASLCHWLVCTRADLRLVYRQDLTTQLSTWGLGDAGFNYNLVAVFGSQSTGKSNLRATTLLTKAWFADEGRWDRYAAEPIIRYRLRRHERGEEAADHQG